MNALEWIILVIMLFSALLAATQGFFFEVICLAGAVFGFLLAAWGYGTLSPWFLQYVKLPAFADLAGFLTIFLSGLGGCMLGGAWFVAGDRVRGAAVGIFRGVVVVTAVLMASMAFMVVAC